MIFLKKRAEKWSFQRENKKARFMQISPFLDMEHMHKRIHKNPLSLIAGWLHLEPK
jgi:hypothetical protein